MSIFTCLNPKIEMVEVYKLIQEVTSEDPSLRTTALEKLANNREYIENLAPLIYFSTGTMAILIKEIVAFYENLKQLEFKIYEENQNHIAKAINIMYILQSVASNKETNHLLIRSELIKMLYPILNLNSEEDCKAIVEIRVAALLVIAEVLKACQDESAVRFLLQNDFAPICLKSLNSNNLAEQTTGIFIFQQIIMTDLGLKFFCSDYLIFSDFVTAMNKIVKDMIKDFNSICFQHCVLAYLRLSEDKCARETMSYFIPKEMFIPPFTNVLNKTELNWVQELLTKLRPLKFTTVFSAF